ncbi:MAG: hypothetical protein WCS73_09790 [Lentisphaeria bacterium]
MRKLLFIIASLLLLVGCNGKYTEVAKTDLRQAFILNSSPTFQGYYYEGSDTTHHYFRSQWKYGRDKYFKVAIKDLTLSKTQDLNKNEIRVYVISLGETAQVLFEIDGHKVYKKD